MQKKISLLLLMLLAVGSGAQLSREQNVIEAAAITSEALNGWDYDFNNGAQGSVDTSGPYIVINVENAGTADWHAKLARYGQSVEADSHYRWVLRAKASRAVKANFLVNPGEKVANWDRQLSTNFEDYSFTFYATENATNIEYLFQFGGNWEENRREPFTLMIEKLVIEKVAGVEEVVYEETFATSSGAYYGTDEGPDTSTANWGYNPTNQSFDYTITKYHDEPSLPWSLRIRSGATGVSVSKGSSYVVKATIITEAPKDYELSISDSNYEWTSRAGLDIGQFSTGLNNYVYTFTASQDIADVHLNFEIGAYEKGVSDQLQTLSIENVVIAKINYVAVESDETRVGVYVSEFAAKLGEIDSCVADGVTGYLAYPQLKAAYYDRLIDLENITTTYVKDYNYSYGQSSDPKVDGAVTCANKWAMIENMYNLNITSGSDMNLRENNNEHNLILVALTLTCLLTGFVFLGKKRQQQ